MIEKEIAESMIIACSCGAKLRINEEKLGAGGVRIKCPRCSTVHLAQKPVPDAPEAPAMAVSVPPAPDVSMPWFAPSSAAVPVPAAGGPLVLVAHDSQVVADMIDGVLKGAGIATVHASNGLEALRMATELKPQAMVVDVGLTGIYGFELCERLKNDSATKGIRVILLSSVYGLTAYKRAPVNLYGADDYIEKHHIPDGLVPKLRALLSESAAAESEGGRKAETENAFDKEAGLSPEEVLDGGAAAPAPPEEPSIFPKTPVTLGTTRARDGAAPLSSRTGNRNASQVVDQREDRSAPVPSESAAQPVPAVASPVRATASDLTEEEYRAPGKKGTAAVDPADPAEVEKARRFARIIVSDIALYNQDAVTEGIRQGTFYDLLRDDIAEGRSVYEERVPEAVRRTKDFLQEAFDDFIESKKKLR